MIKRALALILVVIMIFVTIEVEIFANEKFNFLIVTTTKLVESIKPLANHRTEQGYIVKIETIDKIHTDSSKSISENLWDYLNENYSEWGLSHLLIVGDYRDIPQARLCSSNGAKDIEENQPGIVYTDIYYSVLGQDWDSNGNGLLGEPIDDVKIDPQISVGRIPFSGPKIIESWVENVTNYDESRNKRRALQVGAVFSFDNEDGVPTTFYTDGASMHNVIWDEILSKNNFSRFRIFETDSLGIDKSIQTDRALNSSNILSVLSENEFGMVNILAHGTKTTIMRKRWQRDVNNNGHADNNVPGNKKEILIETLLSSDQVSSIDINPGIVIATACSTAYIATSIDSLATSFLRSGASAYIGGSALNYFYPGWNSKEDGGNQTISYNLTKYYVDGATLGWSLMSTLRDYFYSYNNLSKKDKTLQNIYSFVLLGDPTMKLEPPKSVKQISVFLNPKNQTITSGETSSVNIEIGDVNSDGIVKLEITPRINGIDFRLPSEIIHPGDDFGIDIETSITLKPGDYEFKITCSVEEYTGVETLRLKIIPPAQTTNIKLEPDYTLVTQNQEFWLNLIVEPTKPVDKLAGTLSYDSNCFDFIGYRTGNIVTEDYRCLDSISVENRPAYSDLVFSIDRNVDVYGFTNTGVVFSFCFRGRCPTEKGSQKFAVSSLNIQSNKDDGSRKHSFSSLPHSLVNVKKIAPDVSDFFIHTGIETNFEFDADLNTSEDNLVLKGAATVGTILYINDKPIPVDSEGFYNTSIHLSNLFTDIELKIEDEYNRYLMIKRRVKKTTIRELAFHNDEKSAWANGKCQILDANPYIKSGRTLVPIRFIAEQLDFVVSWDQTEKRVDISKNGTYIKMWVGSNNSVINGKNLNLDVPPEITNGRTFVPLRFISEALSCKVSWDSKTRSAVVTYNTSSEVVN